MNTADVKILAEPITNLSCRFTVDRPVYPEASYYFGSPEKIDGSNLATRLFSLEGVVSCLIAHDTITVDKSTPDDWPDLARKVGASIREHIASGEPAVSEQLREDLPPAEEIRDRVQQVLDTEVNPAVASHGGVVQLLEVRENNVFVQLGGGCQGCGMANVTLRHGVEAAIRKSIPEVGAIYDATDHAAGRDPYHPTS